MIEPLCTDIQTLTEHTLFVIMYKYVQSTVTKSPVPVAARSEDVGLRPLACWDCGSESRRAHGWMSVCCDCFVLSGRGLCDGLITYPEESVSPGVIKCNINPLHL